MSSTGRWIHGTKRSTALIAITETPLGTRRAPAAETKWSSRGCSLTKNNNHNKVSEMKPLIWFPDRSPGFGQKNNKKKGPKVETTWGAPGPPPLPPPPLLCWWNGGKASQFSVLHNNQIPHACAEETSWRRFWSSSCIGIFSHPSGSVGEP